MRESSNHHPIFFEVSNFGCRMVPLFPSGVRYSLLQNSLKFSDDFDIFGNVRFWNDFATISLWKIHHRRIFVQIFWFFSKFWWVPKFARFAWKCFNKKLERFFGFKFCNETSGASLKVHIFQMSWYQKKPSTLGESRASRVDSCVFQVSLKITSSLSYQSLKIRRWNNRKICMFLWF